MELTIDTASPTASVALTEGGALLAELTWKAGRGHAAELIPAIERLLAGGRASMGDVDAVFVNRGPGGYAGLRVGLSTALSIAYARDADVLGYGRLEADARPLLALGRPVVAVHDAGRGELAWAVYRAADELIEEIAPPTIGPPDELLRELPDAAVVVGEVSDALSEALVRRNAQLSVIRGAAAVRRAATGAALAWPRYEAGGRDSHLALTPVYLREPNITQRRAP